MIRIISYSSFFCKSTHLLFTTLRENQDIMFIHIKEITVREKRLSSMNSTTPFKKPTIKIPFLSMNFLKTWQPYRTVTYIALASKEVLFWNFKWIQECFHLLNWAYLPVLIYLRHSAQKINKEHVDQTSNNPQRSRTTNLCNNMVGEKFPLSSTGCTKQHRSANHALSGDSHIPSANMGNFKF